MNNEMYGKGDEERENSKVERSGVRWGRNEGYYQVVGNSNISNNNNSESMLKRDILQLHGIPP